MTRPRLICLTNILRLYGTVDNGVQPVCTDFINCTKSLDTVKFNTFDVAIVMSKLTRNSSGDEIANVNFLYDDIVHVLQNTIDSWKNSATDRRGGCVGTYVYQIQ